MAPQVDTHYGALSVEPTVTRKSGKSATTLKFLVGLALAAVCVTAAVFALTAPVQQEAVSGAVDMKRVGPDCECKAECDIPKGKKMGTCEIKNAADKMCADYTNSHPVLKDGKYIAQCVVYSGHYDCTNNPCKNAGVCLEDVTKDAGFECVCPFGFEGDLCGKRTSFCAADRTVCAPHATCWENLGDKEKNFDLPIKGSMPVRNPGDPAYRCVCNVGYHGHGYLAADKKPWGGKAAKGTMIGPEYSKKFPGWITKAAKGEEQCSDVNDCTHVVMSGNKVAKASPCKNGGKCSDNKTPGTGYSCDCSVTFPKTSYTGTHCEIDVDECATGKSKCMAHSQCINDPKRTPGSYLCTCNTGWTGDGFKKCEDINDCAINGGKGTCLNGGTCVRGVPGTGKHTCDCPETWKGPTCAQDVDECKDPKWASKCSEWDRNGVCHNQAGSWTCGCNAGYTGTPTATGAALSKQDLATCLIEQKWFTKEAVAKMTDAAKKENAVLKLAHLNLDVQKDRTKQKAKEAELRKLDAAALTKECNALMSPQCRDEDDCAGNPCKAGACSDKLRGFECTCEDGFRGQKCDHDWDECALGIDTCHRAETEEQRKANRLSGRVDAICHNTLGSYDCKCPPGYWGSGHKGGQCTPIDTCKTYHAPEPMCRSVAGKFDTRSVCTKDADCGKDGSKCVEDSFCQSGKCGADKKCLKTEKAACAADKECASGECKDKKCTEVIYAVTAKKHKRPTCVKPDDGRRHVVRPKKVTDKNGQDVEPCGEWNSRTKVFQKHGKCTANSKGYTCNCEKGWTNHDCNRDEDECLEDTHTCGQNARCFNKYGPQKVNTQYVKGAAPRYATLGFTCKCNLGYTGDPYSARCHDIDDCVHISSTCSMDSPNSGAICEINADCGEGGKCLKPKKTARCVNGVCKDLGVHSWTCNCIEGWTDADCGKDRDECAHGLDECGKNAHCINTDGSYMCKCDAGYLGNGQQCQEIDDCASNPCVHGKCKDHGVTGYGCTCEKGWKDSKCDFDENECLNGNLDKPCAEHGKCVNSPGSYFCRCLSGTVGDGYRCDDLDDCDPDPCQWNSLGCRDAGPNKYVCKCKKGWTGKHCRRQVNECKVPSLNMCDKRNGECTERATPEQDKKTVGYTCRCKEGFYGDGFTCSKCKDCSGELAPTRYQKKPNGPFFEQLPLPGGFERDPKGPNCRFQRKAQNICKDIDECTRPSMNKCDPGKTTCINTPGSYECKCHRGYYTEQTKKVIGNSVEPGHKCIPQTRCKLGEIMLKDATEFTDRVCRPILPDGFYALQNTAGSTKECLALWNEAEKVYPERYNWGGKDTFSQFKGKLVKDPMDRPGYIAAADKCENPICGVCNFNGNSAKKNILAGNVAAWKIVRADPKSDTYLILAQRAPATGKGVAGYRCLGFDRTPKGESVVAYPQLLSWKKHKSEVVQGKCATFKDGKTTINQKKKCKDDKTCGEGSYCHRGEVMDGSWSTNEPGFRGKITDVVNGKEELQYFCGLNSLEQLKQHGNSQTLWNIHAMGCTPDSQTPARWQCKEQKYGAKFLVRSMADMEKLGVKQPQCLYFPPGETNPRRVPTVSDGVTWGGAVFKGDGNEDHECGIMTVGKETQEEALLRNAAAVFEFIPLFNKRW